MSLFFGLIFLLSLPALLLGMIAPQLYSRFFNKGATRGKIAKVLGAVMVVSLTAAIATTKPVEQEEQAGMEQGEINVANTLTDETTQVQDSERGVGAVEASEDAQADSNASGGVIIEPTNPSAATSSNSAPDSVSESTTTGTSNTPTTVEPTPAPSTPAASCSCSSDIYNCDDFSTHAEAQALHDCCVAQTGSDVHGLDKDNNGQACESLP